MFSRRNLEFFQSTNDASGLKNSLYIEHFLSNKIMVEEKIGHVENSIYCHSRVAAKKVQGPLNKFGRWSFRPLEREKGP
jgi:hypothetical protein